METNQPINILFPFWIDIDPMEKLLLVNFENDPDTTYVAFEPQVFNDPTNGVGHLLIGWRTDKKVDVYHQRSLNPDPSKYTIAGAGLNQMIPVDMDHAFFDVNDRGVQAHYRFADVSGRTVEISIKERNAKKRKPFGLLAPMGDAASNPRSLPLVLLQDFYFVRKNHTALSVSINNRSHTLDRLPVPLDWQQMIFARYSPKPLIATLNPAYSGILEGFDAAIGQKTAEKGNRFYAINWIDRHAHIKSIGIKNAIHPLTMSFSPSFPSLNSLPENTQLKGGFRISGHASVGSIAGDYLIRSEKETIGITLVPSKGWKPKTTKFSTWFLFTVVRVFKKWPSTYRWEAALQKRPDGSWHMQSKWIRTGKILKD
ncbi:hypothetical protein [Cyclobacterium xiamenense]|uniref:hypothetical protein n=1 Tax=Cyclobacterium xiamenense TaxID=1297121 RepID=UPI0012B6BF78|nr:hypothetical protein [Cyclobacterium xiamenense]